MHDYNQYVTAINKIFDLLAKMKAGWNSPDNFSYIEKVESYQNMVTTCAEAFKQPAGQVIQKPAEETPPVEQAPAPTEEPPKVEEKPTVEEKTPEPAPQTIEEKPPEPVPQAIEEKPPEAPAPVVETPAPPASAGPIPNIVPPTAEVPPPPQPQEASTRPIPTVQ